MSKTILVTGASGYIASWIIKYLLEAGHTVHGTVRDLNKAASVDHLKKIAANAPGTLKLFQADLLTPNSYDEACQGCEIVMHTASPFILHGFTDAYEALVKPAVEGTKNVLASVNKTDSVKRVVLTSSAASIYGDNDEVLQKKSRRFDESDWNTTSNVDHNPYQYSKAEAERTAWTIQKQQSRWDMVTINPVMVYGPSLTSSSASGSIDVLVQMGDGSLRSGVPNLYYGVVDVREVAQAHIAGGLKPEAEGRFMMVNESLSMLEIATILRNKFGSKYPFPKMEAPKILVWLLGPLMGPVTRKFISKNVGVKVAFDNSRSRNILGINYRPSSETFNEHFQQMLDDGIIKKR